MNKLDIPASRLPAKYVRISHAFQALHQAIKDIQYPLVLTGIGGTGKTSLCQDYYNNTDDKYQHKIWIPFQVDIFNSLTAHTKLIENLQIENFDKLTTQAEQLQQILYAIKAFEGKKLIVIDALDRKINGEEREFLLDLPNELHATILISSRNNLKGFDEMPMPVMSVQDAKIIYAVYRDKISVNTQKAHLIEVGFDMPHFSTAEIELIQYAQRHPLLLELIAKTINNDISITPKILLQKFTTYAPILSDESIYMSRTKKEKNIQEQLQIIFEAVKLPEAQRDILREISLLPSIQIPYEELKTYIHKKERSHTFLQKNIQQLINYGWLQREGHSLQMHRAIQFTIDAQIPYEKNKHFHVVYNLLKINYEKINYNILQAQPLIIYIKHLVPFLLKNNDKRSAATSYNNLASIYKGLGYLEISLIYQKKSLDIDEEILDNKHPILATSYSNLASIYQALGKSEQALKYEIIASTIFEKSLDAKHLKLATSYNSLAIIYQSLGFLSEALKYQKKSVDILEQILDVKHLKLATSYTNLASIYQSLGFLSEALQYQKKAIVIEEKTLDNKHPNLATSYSNLSIIYQKLNNLEYALIFQKQALIIRKQILIPNHPDLATSYHNLASIYKSLGFLSEALQYQKKAIAILEQKIYKKHPNLATSYSNIAGIYQDLGNLAVALSYQEKAIDIHEQILDNKHPDLASSYNNLAMIYQALGNLAAALSYQEKAIDIMEQIFDKKHPSLADSYHNLSTMLIDKEDFEQALVYNKKALAIWQYNFPNGHPHIDIALQFHIYIKEQLGML